MRRPILQLHVLLAVMLIYFGLYGANSEFPRSIWAMAGYGAVVAGYIAGLFLMPAARWDHPSWVVGVFLTDLALTTAALYITQGFQGDLYLMYFLVILMAGLANTIHLSLLIGGLAGSVYLLGVYAAFREGEVFTPVLLMRVPFLFVVALICSYFVRRVGQERLLRREAQHLGVVYHQQLRDAEESLRLEQRKSEFSQTEWREAAQSVREWQARFDRAEARLRAVLQSTHDVAVALTPDGRIADVNARVHAVLGVSPAAVIGRPFQAWAEDPAAGEELVRSLGAIPAGQWLVVRSLRMRTARGESVTLEWAFSTYQTAQGVVMVQGLGAVLSDVPAPPASSAV